MTTWLAVLGLTILGFLALPWLALAFQRYCDAVNRVAHRRHGNRR
ncbi:MULTISPECIES: hypothetical protein [Streptomyces]|uniref:Uncharacterized protein n=1 Tax=Streptomyces evansiae TaxID=3075535 RepID=A0ABU2QZP6_9ACTN|nr:MULTISPECIES: hypothetical protein [unclassified Streptomyces]MDT0409922.1 hypothetical protein [Streptomyces sp. DSM 41979]SCE40429.1 hypothetical protein GA0115252_146433 [Streptomyces sp. DfronAA-171]